MDDNIKVDLKEIERRDTDLIHLACNGYQWGAVVNMVINFSDFQKQRGIR
jgi:hypothetical protein